MNTKKEVMELMLFPTDREIALQPDSWRILSFSFYTAGEILYNTYIDSKRKFNDTVGEILTEDDMKYHRQTQIYYPILFNLSISIELLIKSIIVKKVGDEIINRRNNLKFNHDVFELIEEYDICVDDFNYHEIEILKNLKERILDGKYPTKKRIDDSVSDNINDTIIHITTFFNDIKSIRNKLIQKNKVK